MITTADYPAPIGSALPTDSETSTDADMSTDSILQRFHCPCCGYPTLRNKPPGSYEICRVCVWEDDELQFRDHDYVKGAANKVSLRQARINFDTLGISDPQWRHLARPPTEDEHANRVLFGG